MELVKVKQILLGHIPEEIVNKILHYYVSMYFYENVYIPITFNCLNPYYCVRKNDGVSSVYTCRLFGVNVYYTNPKKYWGNILGLTDKKMSQRDKIITIVRYWIQNSDLFLRVCSRNDYKRLRDSIGQTLARNIRDNPNWAENVGKYYYRQVFFKEVVN